MSSEWGPPCGKLNRKSILESNVLIPNMYYRTDIGDRWVEDTDRLHTWGYLR
ncbi:MAG TPA: hypothetical protein VLA42_08680 [Verrucomicrobiae bacterium]|nr:hypothetical protein [Verrucomicrobiae bacterium]